MPVAAIVNICVRFAARVYKANLGEHIDGGIAQQPWYNVQPVHKIVYWQLRPPTAKRVRQSDEEFEVITCMERDLCQKIRQGQAVPGRS